jgi:alkyl sulfatase BDS1-like metallo-beta-lactamase superfamily hydrolase|tara:strand:+ start:99 stop:1832 length:1734 start_codon:yes stop_codon:yes gene_type:complete
MTKRLFIFILFSILVINCSNEEKIQPPSIDFSQDSTMKDEFYREKGVYQVVDNVYVAIGYGLANSILIVGDGGNIIIDTTESYGAASEISEEFRKISNQPIKAVFYTHSHPDHWRGTKAFFEEDTKVYAHKTFEKGFDDSMNLLRPILTKRGMKQFGYFLPDEVQEWGHGLGLAFGWDFVQPPIIYPTHLLEEKITTITTAGITLEVTHSPGETDDQIIIYYPDKEVVVSGDNYYMRFPNLYTIRGSSYRDTYKWYKSVDEMRAYNPEYLISCHGPYLSGKEEVHNRLTIYRDAVQYIHDYAIRGMNQGKTPDELVEEFEYPSFFKENFDLQEKYGKVSWSIRNVYSGYIGFFDGKAVNLEPLSSKQRNKRLLDIIGSKETLIELIKQANDDGDFQWAAELCEIGSSNFPNDKTIKELYGNTLIVLGKEETNPIARNWYLSDAYEMMGLITPHEQYKSTEGQIERIPIKTFFNAMPPRLNPKKANGKSIKIGFVMSDTGQTFGMILRNNIIEITQSVPDNSDATASVNTMTWKKISVGLADAKEAMANGDLVIDGSKLKFAQFFAMFDRDSFQLIVD